MKPIRDIVKDYAQTEEAGWWNFKLLDDEGDTASGIIFRVAPDSDGTVISVIVVTDWVSVDGEPDGSIEIEQGTLDVRKAEERASSLEYGTIYDVVRGLVWDSLWTSESRTVNLADVHILKGWTPAGTITEYFKQRVSYKVINVQPTTKEA